MSEPQILGDQIGAEYRGEEITIWNRLTVRQIQQLGHGLQESHHKILAGDGSTGEVPEYITPQMDEKLRQVDVYPTPEVVDPTDEEVTVL